MALHATSNIPPGCPDPLSAEKRRSSSGPAQVLRSKVLPRFPLPTTLASQNGWSSALASLARSSSAFILPYSYLFSDPAWPRWGSAGPGNVSR